MLRDGLALNRDEDMDGAMPMKIRRTQQQMAMRAQLSSLPAPTNEVEISMPELEDDEIMGEAPLEEDAADTDKRRAKMEEDRREIERQKQSQPVKRGLPRPVAPQTMMFESSFGEGDSQGSRPAAATDMLQKAEDLLHGEMIAMVTHDAFLFPTKGVPPIRKDTPIEDMSLAEIAAGKELLDAEVADFEAAVGGADVISGGLQAALEEGDANNITFLPSAKKYVEWRMIGKAERLEAAKHSFEQAHNQVKAQGKKAQNLEQKIDRILGGFMAKTRTAMGKVRSLAEERETIAVETEVFRTLSAREEKAIETRCEELQELVEREKRRNAKLQNRYKSLKILEEKLDGKLQ